MPVKEDKVCAQKHFCLPSFAKTNVTSLVKHAAAFLLGVYAYNSSVETWKVFFLYASFLKINCKGHKVLRTIGHHHGKVCQKYSIRVSKYFATTSVCYQWLILRLFEEHTCWTFTSVSHKHCDFFWMCLYLFQPVIFTFACGIIRSKRGTAQEKKNNVPM